MPRQRGHAVVFVLALLACLLAAALLVHDSGRLAAQKRRLIDAADAATLSGAVFQARVLNFESYMNRAMVANQAMVTTADPETRSRSNTIFAIHVWGGNATGAFIASIAWAYAGWLGVCASGVAASLVALAVYRLRRAPH